MSVNSERSMKKGRSSGEEATKGPTPSRRDMASALGAALGPTISGCGHAHLMEAK